MSTLKILKRGTVALAFTMAFFGAAFAAPEAALAWNPVITVLGDNPYEMTEGDAFTDPGATAVGYTDHSQSVEVDITADIVVSGDTVSPTTPVGTYTIKYNVTDSHNLKAKEKTRAVVVKAKPTPSAPPPAPQATFFTLVATKILCADETDLPNWGLGGPDVTVNTAAQFLATHTNCHLEPNWNFQWGYETSHDPGGDFVGDASSSDGWHTFGATDVSGRATTTISDIHGGDKVWVREVLKDGYVPFTFDQENRTNENAVSAEIYCHTDVGNYDNFDFLDMPTFGNTYYCIAWNAMKDTSTTTPPGSGGGGNTAPLITALGSNPFTITVGSDFTDPGATSTDAEDGDLTDEIVITGDAVASTTAVGTYTIVYSVTDSGGLSASTTRTVVVAATTTPTTGGSPSTGSGSSSGSGGGGTPPQCLDFVDNDGDGKIDAKDPGCHTDGNPDNTGSYDPFDNSEIDTPTGGSGSPSTGSGSSSGSGGGSAIVECSYLKEFIKRGANNNPVEVMKLQSFLRIFEGANITVSGFYDDASYNAVVKFQEKYFGDVLAPWGHDRGTGFVYLTTRKKVNEIYCKQAFPLTPEQQTEVRAFKAYLESLKRDAAHAGVTITGTDIGSPSTSSGSVDINDIVGKGDQSDGYLAEGETATSGEETLGTTTPSRIKNLASAVGGFVGDLFDSYWFILLLILILIFYFILRSFYDRDEEDDADISEDASDTDEDIDFTEENTSEEITSDSHSKPAEEEEKSEDNSRFLPTKPRDDHKL